MKAVVYKEPYHVSVDNIDDAKVEDSHDGILKITSAAICGSDLHMYEGRTTAKPGLVFGHEILGVVEDVGDCVRSIKKRGSICSSF